MKANKSKNASAKQIKAKIDKVEQRAAAESYLSSDKTTAGLIFLVSRKDYSSTRENKA